MSHAAAHAGPTWAVAVVVAVVLLGGYFAATATVRSRTGRPWRTTRLLAFAGGALALAAGLSPLVGSVGAGPAQAHMAQHVLVGMVAPLGLVLGAPLVLALAALPVTTRRRGTALLRSAPVRALTHPATAGVLHVGGLYALYLTPLHALTLRHPAVHALVLLHFVLAGCLFAWSLVGPERAARRPGMAWRVGVLVVASAAHGYLAKLLYARAPELPPGLARGAGGDHGTAAAHGAGTVLAAAELRDAARWMYYAGDLVEAALACALFAAWYRRAGRRGTTAAVARASAPT